MNPDLAKLIQLQDLDSKLLQSINAISQIPTEKQRLEDEFNSSIAQFNKARLDLSNLEEGQKLLEVQLKELTEQQEKFKADLMKVKNEREYTTCLREIDAAKKSIQQIEAELLDSVEKIEKLRAEVDSRTPEIEERRQGIDNRLKEFEQQLEEHQRLIDALKAEREQLASTISKSVYTNYERISRLRGGQGLAEAVNYSCSACRMTIRPQVFSLIKRSEEVVTCESCSRILFYRSVEETAATAE